jgi:hypothetical protein
LAQQSAIEQCRDSSSDSQRIACLEAALLANEPAAEEPAAEVPAATTPAGIGAEQVIARNQTREEVLDALEAANGLAVASYDVVPYERLLITLANGQVWRQIKGDTQIIRVDLDRNQTVDIAQSSLGGYKMRLNELRRTIRVERLQ